jgi:hypothetical protein
MSWCLKDCCTCQHEVDKEWKVRFAEDKGIHACCAGLTLFPDIEMDNISDLMTDLDNKEDEQDIEEKL